VEDWVSRYLLVERSYCNRILLNEKEELTTMKTVIVFGDLSKLMEDLIPVALQKNETFISFSLITDVW
jgi:hypothetical protein